MAYTGELQRKDPFTFKPPDHFTPWAGRLLTDLRQRLKTSGVTPSEIRFAALVIDQYIEEQAHYVLAMPADVRLLVTTSHNKKSQQAIQSAATTNEIRQHIPDLDLLMANGYGTLPVTDTDPTQMVTASFTALATLALWKMAAASEMAGTSQNPLPSSIALTMESLAAGNIAMTIAESLINVNFHLNLLFGMMEKSIDFKASEIKLAISRVRRDAAVKGNKELWGKYKQRAYELAKSQPFPSYSKAADFIQLKLESELHRHANHRKICDWIKAKGWRPTKSKKLKTTFFELTMNQLPSLESP